MNSIIIKSIIFFSLIFNCFSIKAEPWIDTSNIFLRADIQLLADKGHINSPLTTFPVMWAEVSRSLKGVNQNLLDEESKLAYWHITQQMQRASRGHVKTELNIAMNDKRYTSFGDEYRDSSFIKASISFMGENWAAKVSATGVDDPEDDDEARIDESYLAFFLGNWVFSAGVYDRWWGPGWDNNLVLTNNARPMPSLAITRKTSEPFVMPFINSIKIPWSATMMMSQFEEERHIPNTLLFGVRVNFKLTQNLEIGASRLIQWAGDDRPDDLSTLWDAFLGNDLCADESIGGCSEENRLANEPGNQQGGYDIRYHVDFLSHPFSLYHQMMAEDGNSNSGKIFGQKVYTHGIDTRLNMFDRNWLVFLEFSDTYTDCTNPDRPSLGEVGLGDCFSEHFIYESGMRYKQEMIGTIYDNDSKSFVLGFISQMDELQSWEVKFRYLELNRDDSDKYPDKPNYGNSVTKIAEDVISVSIKYQLRQGKFRFTVGGDLSSSSFPERDLDDSTEPNAYFNVEYTL